MSHSGQGHRRWMGHREEFWQSVVHWRRKLQPTPVFLPQNPMNSMKKQKDTTMKDEPPSPCVDHNKFWKILQEMGIPDHRTCLRNLYVGQEATVIESDMEQWTRSKLRKEYIKTLYCHPAYLTHMQGTPCEMLGWMNHKLQSRLLREISVTSDMHLIPL